MLWLAWQFRAECLSVLILNVILVALNLSGLGLAGLGIDVLRQAFQPEGPVPKWPFGGMPPGTWTPMALVTFVAALVFAVALLQAILKFVAAVAGAALSQRIVIQLRIHVYDKLQRLSFHFFDTNDSSSIINRVAGDVQAVRGFVDGVLLKVLTVARKRIMVSELLDGTLRLTFGIRLLSWTEVSARPTKTKPTSKPPCPTKPPYKPGADHPWRQ